MTAAKLSAKKCVPCTAKTPALKAAEAKELHAQIPEWELSDTKLVRKWRVADFAEGLDFFRRVGEVADAEDHHPDLHLQNYREVTIELWTHAVGGLTENDFIVAAKIDALEPPKLKS
jgi:4a-hydroxytetrahydrobiopterin dehydratase